MKADENANENVTRKRNMEQPEVTHFPVFEPKATPEGARRRHPEVKYMQSVPFLPSL